MNLDIPSFSAHPEIRDRLTLDLPADQREEGTLVTTVYGVQKRCAFVRVHDVEKNKRAIRMTQALMREHDLRA